MYDVNFFCVNFFCVNFFWRQLFFGVGFSRIISKLGGDVAWVDIYQVCSTRGRCEHFLIFYEFFFFFFGKILKNLLLRNRQADFFEITQEHSWGVPDLNLFTRWRCDFFQFFYDFFCVKPIFDFFSRTKVQISPKSTPI